MDKAKILNKKVKDVLGKKITFLNSTTKRKNTGVINAVYKTHLRVTRRSNQDMLEIVYFEDIIKFL